MMRLILLLLSFFVYEFCAGQAEVEPNNTFAQATLLPSYVNYTATVGNGDAIDYHRVNLTVNANFYLLVEATNISGNDGGNIELKFYDGRQATGLLLTRTVGNNPSVDDGETVYDTIYICAKAIDDYYLTFTTNEEFDYVLHWFPVNTYTTDEPNNTSGTATPVMFNTPRSAAIRFEFRGGVNDTEDWFQSGVLPAANYNEVKLYLDAQNARCSGGNINITYQCYKAPDLVTPFATGFIGNDNTVSPGQVVSSVIPLSNLQAGDIMYVRLTSTGPFGYTLKYGDIVPYFDPEDNCCEYNAVHLNEDSIVGGNVGEYDYDNDVYIDEFDAYRIILPHAGAIKIFGVAEIATCGGGFDDPALNYEVLDKYGNNLPAYGTISAWSGTPSCGNLQRDTIKIRAFEADTFYLRLTAYRNFGDNPVINYNFKYQWLDSTGSDAEPNNDTTTAILIDTNQVIKGHVSFKRDYYEQDIYDYYKLNIPADAKMTLYLKSTYRGETTLNNSNAYRLQINYVNNNYSYYSPSQAYKPTLYADSVIYDTIHICPVLAGTAYIRLVGDSYFGAYEYEFSVSYSDTSNWVNDVEFNNSRPTASPIAYAETKTGRLNYYPDRNASIADADDYYRAIMPYDGALKIFVEGRNMTCGTSGGPLEFRGYHRNGTLIHTESIAGLSAVPPGITIYDTITICGQAADTFYFRMSATTQQFRYKIRYEIIDTSANDTEPNNTAPAQATLIGGSQLKRGHIQYESNNSSDANDYYKVIFGSNDSLKIHFSATNMKCTAGESFRMRLLNKNLTQISGADKNKTGVGIGVTVTDSIKIAVTAPDTIYVWITASDPFKYDFTTNPLVPTSYYSLSGDTTACLGQQIYQAHNISDTGITYNWTLPLGGGTINAVDSTATVTWTNEGNRSVRLVITNTAGSSSPRTLNVVVNGSAPSQVPVAFNFARTLSTGSLPPGATVQWYRNDTLIAGATNTSYYAALAGNYTVKFINDCGPGPSSNSFNFPADAQAQTITFPHISTITMSPTAKDTLQATASSGLPVFYQKISGPGNILNDTLFATGVGTIIVKALQPGDDIYSAAPDVFDTITVIKGDQVITFDSIPDQILNSASFILPGSSTSGLEVTYSFIAGSTLGTLNNLSGIAWSFTKKGAGTVTLRASQSGNSNYNAATSVDRTFCIGVRTLTPIVGDSEPCLATYTYRTQKIPGAQYVWTLSGGGILTTNNDTAWVQWQTPGSYSLKVKANSPCDPIYTNEQELLITTSNNIPGTVSGMLPANNAVDQQLPLKLSWLETNNTVSYDLFVWDSAATEPAIPYVANLTTISYTIPKNAPFPYNKTYKWKVVAKNPCAQTAGPIQQFRLIPLPDLVVSDVQAPATATSGQTVTVSWKVTNIGPGKTLQNQYWRDGVYFALDTVPYVNFNGSPNWNPSSWSSLTANGRPLLLGYKDRPSSLDSGQFYTNSINFTLPLGYNFPVYVYVISPNNHPNGPILQASVLNDTARAPNTINITQAPTPDLRTDSVFVPTPTFSGSVVNLTYKVKNYGVVTPAGGVWTDSIFISQNPLFDRNQCIPLYLPKGDGSYYPNAVKANVFNNNQLNADATVTKNVQVVIPNYIFGTWFVYVKTNANTATNGFIYEGALNGNNIGQAQMQIYLTPTPKLTVSSLSVPVTNASTTQPIGASWSIRNDGFRDNIEKNRAHYITMSTCQVSCGSGCSGGCICLVASVQRDSASFGGSYWIDRVYLSTDSTGLNIANARLVNELKHGVQNSGLYADPPAPTYSFVSCPAIVFENINTKNIISSGANYPKDTSFKIPSDLQPGNYYVYVYTNPTKTVWEYPGTPQITRSALPINIQRPDAIVSSITAPPVAAGGQTITVNYNVLNNGPGAVFNHQRKDRLYISNFSSFDGSAQLLNTQTFTESLPVGIAVPHTFTYTIPPATTGNKYFYVVTNYDSLFRETNMTNNTSVSALSSISAALPADLVVSSVVPKDTVGTIFPTTFKYTVVNNGTGTTIGTWTDSLFISCSPAFSAATAKFITSRTQTRTVAAGANYTDSFSHTIPVMSYEISSCFPEQMYAPAYFYIKTNANNGTYEGSNINNNTGGSGSKVIFNPLVDHVMTETFSTRDTVYVGIPFSASWKFKNIGYRPIPEVKYYYSYYDGIYFSADSIANTNDVLANSYLKYGLLSHNDSMVTTRSITAPNIATGDYYMIAKTNYTDGIEAEKILSNNHNFVRNASGQAKKIHVIRPLLPDLVDTIVSAPSSVAVGQPMTVIYKVTNTGVGVTFPGGWKNELRLSNDFLAQNNAGDRVLATRTRTTPLAPGQFYYDTVTVTIPTSVVAANYVLIGWANSDNAVIEGNTLNNLGFHLLNVYLPDSTDIIVSNVIKPDTVYLGQSIDTVKWVVQNTSGVDATGWLTDGVYLSAGNLFDSTATLLGTKYRHINLEPLETDTGRLAPYVTTSAEGNFNLFVKTDLLTNIIESDKTNNTGVTATPIYIKAKELALNIPEPTTLQNRNKYYKLVIPDSLYGSTILVTLKTNDSLLVRNEMFISKEYVPTPAHYDYRFEIPNYGNQQIVMHSVTNSVYYIMVRCINNDTLVQNITLKAVKLPFAILNVHTNSGGNIGNVTVKITGSLFRDSMTAKLSNAGTTIYASAVYYTNSGQVFATFNLQGRPLGVYNVTLTKPDSSTAVLVNGFTIVPANNGGLITGGGFNTGSGNGNEPGCDPGAASGLNSQLVVELIAPASVLLSRPIVLVINFHNPTNFDIPAQTRILYSEGGLKMAFTKEGVPTGTTSLYLEFTETGGPPGIIRAGGSGTIIVHSRAADDIPDPNPVKWKLK